MGTESCRHQRAIQGLNYNVEPRPLQLREYQGDVGPGVAEEYGVVLLLKLSESGWTLCTELHRGRGAGSNPRHKGHTQDLYCDRRFRQQSRSLVLRRLW